MIIDESSESTLPETAPSSGAASLSWGERIDATTSDPSERARLRMRAADFGDAALSARSSLQSLISSIQGEAASAYQTGHDPLTYLKGLYSGHATRVSQEAVDSLTKLATNAQANVHRRIALGEGLLWQTGGRPTASRSETALLNTLSPADAVAYVVGKRMESESGASIASDNSPASPNESGGGQPARTNEEVIADAVKLGRSLAGPSESAAGETCGNFLSLPVDVSYEAMRNAGWNTSRENDLGADGIAPGQVGYCPSTPLANLMNASAQTGVPLSTNGEIWDGPVGTKQLSVFAGSPGQPLFQAYVQVYPASLVGARDFGQSNVTGWPNSLIPWAAKQYAYETWSGVPPEPPPWEPTPLPPQPPPPPTTLPPPPPDSTCCPPDPLERTDGTAKRKFPAWPESGESIVSWCGFIEAYTASFKGFTPTQVTPDEGGTGYGDDAEGQPWWANWLEEKRDQIRTDIQDIFGFAKQPVAGSPLEKFNAVQVANQQLMKQTAITLESDKPELKGKTASLLASYSLISWGDKFTGAPLLYLGKDVEYAVKYLYPREIPGQADVDNLYLSGTIPDSEWECLTRSNGNRQQLARLVRDTKRTVPNVSEQVDLYMREEITFPELRKRLNFQGVQDEQEIFDWIKLRTQLPPFPDIIRFMVRDTENPQVVAEGRLTDGFEENFRGVLADWARQQGVSTGVALKYWVAHWELPSPTMAFEMLARLRPGRVPDDLAVTYESIQRLLAAADYAPGWRDRMTAISYLTPTRTDIKQGFVRGVYDDDEAYEMLRDTKLDEKGARAVLKLLQFEKEQFVRTRTEKISAFSVKSVITSYVAGTLNRAEAGTILEQFGFTPERRDAILDSGDVRAKTLTREKCIRAVRRHYFVGALGDLEAVGLLTRRDVDRGTAEEMVQGWDCERSASVQEVPARKNLDWAVSGVITLPQLEARLKRLRYNDTDVSRYLAEAESRISKAVAAANEKAIRDMLAELRRREAEARRRLKELEAKIKEAEKKQKEKEKEAEKD